MKQRVPPHSIEAERAVIGAIMLDTKAMHVAERLLDSDAFYQPAHQKIFAAMRSLSSRGEPVDITTLNAELKRQSMLSDVGGSLYLSELNMATPTAEHVGHYARIVYERSLLRRLIAVATDAVQRCFEPGADAFVELEQMARDVYALEQRRVGGSRSFDTVLGEVLELIEEMHASGGRLLGMATGMQAYDLMIGGYQQTNHYVLAARPAMGKTAAMLTQAEGLARDGHPVAVFSLEMAAVQLAARSVFGEARVNTLKLLRNDLREHDVEALVAAVGRLRGLPIHIDDGGGLTLTELRGRLRQMIRRHGVRIAFIDFFTLIGTTGDLGYSQELSKLAFGIKGLAKEFRIPIVTLAQLNREVTKRGNKRPQLQDLKETSGLEESADVVTFIHRPEYYGIRVDAEGNSTTGIAEFIIAKQRNGPTGSARFLFAKEYVRFENLEQRYEELPLHTNGVRPPHAGDDESF